MIHFTAHATANVESPLDSAVVLSGPDNGYKLYARDVAETPLRADLVTVSACRSAGERTYSGEGLVGFAWAFLRAGARNVIAGLWDVDDRSTARLMDALYGGLSEEPHAGQSAARRQARSDQAGRPAGETVLLGTVSAVHGGTVESASFCVLTFSGSRRSTFGVRRARRRTVTES